MNKLSILFTFLLFVIPSYGADNTWRIKSIKINYSESVPFLMPNNTEIEFSGGHHAQTSIIEFEHVGFVESKASVPFIIFSGRTCTECDMRTSIYVNPVSDKRYLGESRYAYPGRVLYYLDGTAIEDSRLFYGDCLAENDSTIIWYTRYLSDDNKWHETVYDIDFNDYKVERNPDVISYESLSITEKLVDSGLCTEVEGRESVSAP